CLFGVSKPDRQLSLCSAMHVFQRKAQLGLRLSARSARAGAAAGAGSSGSAAESPRAGAAWHAAEKHFKEIAEGVAALLAGAAEQLVHVDRALEAAPIRRGREFGAILPVRAKLIVLSAFLGVAEDFVRFLNLFELFFGLLVVRIQIGMILPSELPVCLLDFFFLRRSGHTKNLVIIAELYGHERSLLQTDFEAFAGGNHVGIEFTGIGEDFFDVRVFVVWIVMVQGDALNPGFNPDLDRLLPASVSPADVIGQFFGRVLR